MMNNLQTVSIDLSRAEHGINEFRSVGLLVLASRACRKVSVNFGPKLQKVKVKSKEHVAWWAARTIKRNKAIRWFDVGLDCTGTMETAGRDGDEIWTWEGAGGDRLKPVVSRWPVWHG